MSQSRFGAAVAVNNPRAALDNGRLVNQLDGPVRVDHLGGVREAHVTVVLIVVKLFTRTQSKSKIIVLNSSRDHLRNQ